MVPYYNYATAHTSCRFTYAENYMMVTAPPVSMPIIIVQFAEAQYLKRDTYWKPGSSCTATVAFILLSPLYVYLSTMYTQWKVRERLILIPKLQELRHPYEAMAADSDIEEELPRESKDLCLYAYHIH